jgi:hypothetical protein
MKLNLHLIIVIGAPLASIAQSPVLLDAFSDDNWISLGGISGANNVVLASVVDASGKLYIGGAFTQVGGTTANHIAKWDGSSWSALGSGLNDYVDALAVSGNNVYVGGGFTTAGGIAANYIAKWNGSSWSALGSGMNNEVDALAVSGSDLYVGGVFTRAGGSAAKYIAKWDGSSWSALGSGVNGDVYALAVVGNDLYAGGGFSTAGGKVSEYIARAYLLPLPTLSVRPSSISQGGITVSWPSTDTADFLLQQTGTPMTPASWVSNTTSNTDDGTTKSVTLPATNSVQFFRLRRP